MPLPAVRVAGRNRVHRTPRRVHWRRHVVPVVGGGRPPVLAVDGRERQRPEQQLGREERHHGAGPDSRRRSPEAPGDRAVRLQVRPGPLCQPLPLREPRARRRLVLRHLLPASVRRRQEGGRDHVQLAVARAVRRLPLVDRSREDVDADPLHAGKAALRREGAPGRAGEDRRAALRGFREGDGALAGREGLPGRPRRVGGSPGPPLCLQQLDHRRRDLPRARHAFDREHERRLEIRVQRGGRRLDRRLREDQAGGGVAGSHGVRDDHVRCAAEEIPDVRHRRREHGFAVQHLHPGIRPGHGALEARRLPEALRSRRTS
jgi:hypothetical protein